MSMYKLFIDGELKSTYESKDVLGSELDEAVPALEDHQKVVLLQGYRIAAQGVKYELHSKAFARTGKWA